MARKDNDYEKSETESISEHLDFKSDKVFRPALLGLYRGRTVRVRERGNTQGMSATFWISDRGRNKIVSIGSVTLLDGDSVAPTIEQLRSLLRQEEREEE